MARSHTSQRWARADARRQLKALRGNTAYVGIAETVTDNLLDQHFSMIDFERDDER